MWSTTQCHRSSNQRARPCHESVSRVRASNVVALFLICFAVELGRVACLCRAVSCCVVVTLSLLTFLQLLLLLLLLLLLFLLLVVVVVAADDVVVVVVVVIVVGVDVVCGGD